MKKILFFLGSCFILSGIQAQCLDWAKRMGGNMGSLVNGITKDAWGNLFVTGAMRDTVDFAPDNGHYMATTGSINWYQIYVAKFDQNGNIIWVRTTKGLNGDGFGDCLSTDTDGSVYITGYFKGSTDFDPGPDSLILGSSNPNTQSFIWKLDANGNFRWAHCFAGNTGYNHGNEIKVTRYNEVIAVGSYTDSVDFDPGVGTFEQVSYPASSGYILKLDTAGNFIWVKSIQGTKGNSISALSVDQNQNIIVKGNFKDSVDLDPGVGTLNLFTSDTVFGDNYIIKLDGLGNLIWGKGIIGAGDFFYQHIESDNLGNIYTVGQFNNSFDVDPGPGTYMLNFTASHRDIYWLKLNPNGDFLKAGQTMAVGPGLTIFALNDMIIDSNYSIYTCGFFQGDMDVDPGPGSNILSSGIQNEIFIMKMDSGFNLTWAYNIDSSNNAVVRRMVTNSANDLLLAGHYAYSIDVNPCPGDSFLYPVMQGSNLFLIKTHQYNMGLGEDSQPLNLTLYPNPTTDISYISGVQEYNNINLVVTGINGEVLLSRNYAHGNTIGVDLNSLSAGMYFIHIYMEGRKSILKVIKN